MLHLETVFTWISHITQKYPPLKTHIFCVPSFLEQQIRVMLFLQKFSFLFSQKPQYPTELY